MRCEHKRYRHRSDGGGRFIPDCNREAAWKVADRRHWDVRSTQRFCPIHTAEVCAENLITPIEAVTGSPA